MRFWGFLLLLVLIIKIGKLNHHDYFLINSPMRGAAHSLKTAAIIQPHSLDAGDSRQLPVKYQTLQAELPINTHHSQLLVEKSQLILLLQLYLIYACCQYYLCVFLCFFGI